MTFRSILLNFLIYVENFHAFSLVHKGIIIGDAHHLFAVVYN
jgi:hypothetical protein